jgi:hypothetical protein
MKKYILYGREIFIMISFACYCDQEPMTSKVDGYIARMR